MDLNRQHLVSKVRSAQRRLESLEAASIEEQRQYQRGCEAEVERAAAALEAYDAAIAAGRKA
jgi:hypothetical protein